MYNKKTLISVLVFLLVFFSLGCGQVDTKPVGIGEADERAAELAEPAKPAEKKEDEKEDIETVETGEEGLLSLDSIDFFKDGIDVIYISAPVRNNSDRVVRDYTIAWMGFDENGYPVKTGWLQDEFLAFGNAEAANIQPGDMFGKDFGWDLGYDVDVRAKKFIVCIVEANFYEGEDWKNPYFDTWKSKYLNKPMPENYEGIIGINNY